MRRPRGLYESWLLICAVVLLPLVAFLLKRRGFRKTERFLAKWSRQPRTSESAELDASARRVADMVAYAADKAYRAQPLEQAITLWWMLGLMGIETSVRMGIYKIDGEVQALAWVMKNDAVLLGREDGLDDYEPLVDVNINRPSATVNDG